MLHLSLNYICNTLKFTIYFHSEKFKFKIISSFFFADGNTSSRKAKRKIREKADFENPEHDLFIWAVLFNRREMAALFWQLGKSQLGNLNSIVVSKKGNSLWKLY